MSYQILPNIIFILAVLGILLIILKHLPEAAESQDQPAEHQNVNLKLLAKGLPAEAFSKIRVNSKLLASKAWNFVLEAKDLKPHANVGYKMKKIFGGRQPTLQKAELPQPVTTREVRDENYYLEVIKLQPRNLANYDALGRFYLEQNSVTDAKDIYLYLVNHEPANPDYQARLAFCYYQTKDYAKAAQSYQKSLGLDSTQPNRYYNLGLSQDAAGNTEEAARSLEQAVHLEPAVKYYVSLSNVYLKLGNALKAKQVLLAAQTKEPHNELVKNKLERFAKV